MNNEVKVPFVSILVITYNQENYIEQCIRSVLSQQTKYLFEIVVSDDHSSDQTPYILEWLKNSNSDKINFISNNQNVGIVKNYLRALNQCQGKYICLLGGDDYWIDNLKIQKQVDFLEANKDYGLVYTDYNVLNESSGQITTSFINKSGRKTIEGYAAHKMCLGDSQIMPQTVCIRAKWLNDDYRTIMDDDNFAAEDFPTWFWISYHSKIHFLSILSATYRVHKKSFTNSQLKYERWNFSRSHIYMRKKLMFHLNYLPPNWEAINNKILRGVMNLSLKTSIGTHYGLYSYNLINNKNLEDYLTFLGIQCRPISFVTRGLIYILNLLRKKLPLNCF